MTRADRVCARFDGIDALLVTSLVNLRYLTGFTGSNGAAVIGPGIRRFLTDFRYVERAQAEVDGFEVERAPQDFFEALSDGWPAGVARLGFEEHVMTVKTHGHIAALLPDGIELVAADQLVEAERAVKEPAEIERVAAAAAVADAALRSVLEYGLSGRTERAVAAALEDAMRREGATPAFDTIVASGGHGALPHATPRDVVIAKDTLVTIDWGAKLEGYNSDCTRTFATGRVSAELEAIYELVRRAQGAALDAVRPGPVGKEVDAVARDMIAAAGHAEHFGHGLGHGVGLEVHEAPRLATTATDELVPGNVVTVEPGVYVPGVGGVRIEDLVTVTEAGHRVFSSLEKGLLVVG